MPEISYEEAAAPSGNQFAGIIWGLAPLIQAEACSFYETYPDWVLFSPFGSSDPLTPVRRNLWNRLCPSAPKPREPPPAGVPATGGQCPGISYRAVAHFHLTNIPNGYAEYGSLVGPISVEYQLHSTAPSPVCSPGEISIDTEIGLRDSYFGYHSMARGGGCEPELYWILDDLTLTRNDGLPDTCGNQPPVPLPPPPTPPMPPINVTVTGTNGDVYNYSLQLKYDPTIVTPTPVPPGHDYSTDPNFNINFVVNNSFNVSLNHYGFNFNFGDGAASNAAQAAADTGAATSAATTASGAATDAATQAAAAAAGVTAVGGLVQTAVNNAVPAKPQVLTPQPPNAPPKTGVATLYGLQVTLTVVPANANPQKGVTGPDIYQGGWIEFSRGTYAFPRQPINYLDSVFIAPVGADGYAITYKEGYSGFATEIQNTP